MSIAEKLSLGVNTTFIGMAIVFLLLIALWFIVAIEHKVIESFTAKTQKSDENTPVQTEEISSTAAPAAPIAKSGKSAGKFVIDGVDNDEIVAVALAAVSEYTNIPMNELKITSIKAL